MRPEQFGSQCSASEKIDLVLRLLAGETLADLSRETGRPRRQLSAWRRRFLEAGKAGFNGRHEQSELDELRGLQAEFSGRVTELEFEKRMLLRQVALLCDHSRRSFTHPYCSEIYALACEEPGAERLYVAAWDTYVLVWEGQAGVRQATGVRPYGSLDPGCNPKAGLEELREAGISSFSSFTDPMWCPEESSLNAAFDVYRPFAECHLVDREGEVRIRKRHRNRINQARHVGEVHEVSLAEHLDRWLELYQGNVGERQISRPFTDTYFARLAALEGLRTVAVVVDGEIVAMSLWIAHRDTMYFHEGASNSTGRAVSAAHAGYAHVIETSTSCRFVLLGPRGGFRDEPSDGVAMFKRGFANASAVSYLCSSSLNGET